MIILKKFKSIYKLLLISILATFTVASSAKLVSKVKLATTILISLIVLNAHASFAETKNPFDGNYVGVKIGYVNPEARSTESTEYNTANVGEYSEDGEMGSLFVGRNFLINDLFYFGTELELGKLNIQQEKQLPANVGEATRVDDSIAMTSDGKYLSPGLRFGLLKENTNYFIKAGKVYSQITQSFRDNNPTGATLDPPAQRADLEGNSFGFGFEHFNENNGLVYRAGYTEMDFGTQGMSTVGSDNATYTFVDELRLKIFSIGISKKF